MKLEELTDEHNLDNFCCEVDSLNRFLKNSALLDTKNLLSKTYVVTENEGDKTVIAFCTLVLHCLKDSEKEFFIDKEKCKEQKVPALLIGQLGVDKRHKGKHIGASLIQQMLKFAIAIKEYVHFPVIIIDANKESLVKYYEDKGFVRFKDKGLRLFLPMKEILDSVA